MCVHPALVGATCAMVYFCAFLSVPYVPRRRSWPKLANTEWTVNVTVSCESSHLPSAVLECLYIKTSSSPCVLMCKRWKKRGFDKHSRQDVGFELTDRSESAIVVGNSDRTTICVCMLCKVVSCHCGQTIKFELNMTGFPLSHYLRSNFNLSCN